MNPNNFVMEAENHNPSILCQSQDVSSCTHVSPGDKYPHYHPTLGRIIPNRIFVGGINFRVNESELRHAFSQFGAVKDVKIVTHRTGMSKGYGFVTFESQEDVFKILNNANGICLKDKRLSIGQAFHKQQHYTSGQIRSTCLASPEPARPRQVSQGTLHLTTSTGFPYVFHNGVAYFHCPTASPAATNWPSADSQMLYQSHQPSYQPAACQHHQNPWNYGQPELPTSTLMYSHQSEYLFQPADEYLLQYPFPVMEETPAEISTAPSFFPGSTQFAPHYEPEKSFFAPSMIHRKAKYRRVVHHKSHHFLQESPEPPHASTFHSF